MHVFRSAEGGGGSRSGSRHSRCGCWGQGHDLLEGQHGRTHHQGAVEGGGEEKETSHPSGDGEFPFTPLFSLRQRLRFHSRGRRLLQTDKKERSCGDLTKKERLCGDLTKKNYCWVVLECFCHIIFWRFYAEDRLAVYSLSRFHIYNGRTCLNLCLQWEELSDFVFTVGGAV